MYNQSVKNFYHIDLETGIVKLFLANICKKNMLIVHKPI